MDENEILARFGIGKKFAYGLFIQSIFVIIAAIFALNRLQWNFFNVGSTFSYISAILIFVNCISLIIYSFYEYNKNTEYFFIISIILYTINTLICIINFLLKDVNSLSITFSLILLILEVICVIYFLYAFNKNYNSAKYAIILIVIFDIFNQLNGCLIRTKPWYVCIPFLVIPISIALTYFERVQRGKYPKLK